MSMDDFVKELLDLISETNFGIYEDAFAYTGFDVMKIREKVKIVKNATYHVMIIFAYVKVRGTNYQKGIQKMSSKLKTQLIAANKALGVQPKPMGSETVTYGRLVAAFPMEFATVLEKCEPKFTFDAYKKAMTFPSFAALIPSDWINAQAAHLRWCIAFNGIINPRQARADNLQNVGRFWKIAFASQLHSDEDRKEIMSGLGITKRQKIEQANFPAGIRVNTFAECMNFVLGMGSDGMYYQSVVDVDEPVAGPSGASGQVVFANRDDQQALLTEFAGVADYQGSLRTIEQLRLENFEATETDMRLVRKQIDDLLRDEKEKQEARLQQEAQRAEKEALAEEVNRLRLRLAAAQSSSKRPADSAPKDQSASKKAKDDK